MIKIKRSRPDDDFKARIRAIKPQLKQIGRYTRPFIDKYPEYNTIEGIALIARVVNLRSCDVLITERLEEIVKDWEAGQLPFDEKQVESNATKGTAA